MHVGDDRGLHAAAGDVLCARALDLPQTRTQRVQRMQRLWSMPNRSWLMSTGHLGKQVVETHVVHALPHGQVWSSQLPLATHTAAHVVALGEEQLDVIRRYLRSRSVLVVHPHPLEDLRGARRQELGDAGTSTRHIRQAPTSETPSRWQSVGIEIPASARPPGSSVPAALTSFPSIVRVLAAMDHRSWVRQVAGKLGSVPPRPRRRRSRSRYSLRK